MSTTGLIQTIQCPGNEEAIMLRLHCEESRKVSNMVSTTKIVICLLTHESQVELEFGSVGFWGQRKTGVLQWRKTSRSKEENQQQTQPT